MMKIFWVFLFAAGDELAGQAEHRVQPERPPLPDQDAGALDGRLEAEETR